MSLTVLSVAYPLATVGPDAVGGAEQVLTMLDVALTAAGHRSIVIASEGSRVTGTLIEMPRSSGAFSDPGALAAVHARQRARVDEALARWPVDLVHLHGLDFFHYLPPAGVPTLVTLHLPPSWYPQEIFRLARPGMMLHTVSAAQRRDCPPDARLLPPIPNGVPVERLRAPVRKRSYCAALGRISPEKGFHHALEAARRADAPLLLAGTLFPYPGHTRYFEREIVPRLDRRRRFIGPLGFRGKRRLLGGARALLVPSDVAETSSLVAMEALACGTPVIAFPTGALPAIVDDGRTGFLVHGEREMADAIDAARAIDPDACRRSARERFSAAAAARRYLALYGRIAAAARGVAPLEASDAPFTPAEREAIDAVLGAALASRPERVAS